MQELYPHYCQADPRWNIRILGRNRSFKQAGCAVTASAMFASGYLSELSMAKGGSPVKILPTDVDDYLDKNRGYTGDSLLWSKIVDFINSKGGDLGNVEFIDVVGRSLSSVHFRTGRPGLLRVGHGDSYHFVLLKDSSGRIHDPGTSRGADVKIPGNYVLNRITWFLPKGMMSAFDMQTGLAALKYEIGKIDGLVGPRTLRALAAFQTDQKLTLTGYLDALTQARLTELAGSKIKPRKP